MINIKLSLNKAPEKFTLLNSVGGLYYSYSIGNS